ncbi:tyrosine-type recombinase/integrase [Burkholderia pseudomallei]|uniref:tyrosine-type recombinase/integrase n=1 Tax=Burkholderia pseudomallei TaxID=28450 RepID=UPI0009B5BE26|nr:tyrosine-type recombinase/integrase [Burkholderia pseudomallei]NVH98439.1 tyrosine-type recombinase/integrase [Burkholderia pseudomallei]NVI23647.1 tyrosine-type recombinase/integrase [Burkholderia pseudomallei]CAJ3962949.1 phage integrase family protein [Burkholderia pseudomallei]CAJ4991599.1 phage integrase family protein [Burkholderia pseudomallei]CAJ5600012.1 phage integrase family protein [Burkholderia pseudomallei]
MPADNFLAAQLIHIDSIPTTVTIQSSGESLDLTAARNSAPIYCVVDSRGAIVTTLTDWLKSLVESAGLSNTLSSVVQYGRTATYLCRWIETSGPFRHLSVDENILRLSRQNLTEWLNGMRKDEGLAPTTLHSREAAIRTFLEWLTTIAAGRIRDPENSPYGRDGMLPYITSSPKARSPRFLPAEYVVQILSGMHNECERCMFHTQFDCGLRISEVANLKRGDIPDLALFDSAHEFLPFVVRRSKGRGGNSPEKSTLISRAVLNRIKRYHSSIEYRLAPDWDINDPNKPAFLTTNQLRWSTRNASKQFKEAVRRSDVHHDVSTHWFRHGTAFSVLRSDIGKTYEEKMLVIQQMLGHASLKTTEIYTQVPPALLTKLTLKGKDINRLHEAEFIREKTFLGSLQHTEKRGHHA